MKEKLYIIKIGGALIDDDEALDQFLNEFSNISGNRILVHGGGKLTSTLAEKLHVPQQMVDGRRVTDAQTLDIATMVYAGKINKSIVAKLQNLDCDAMGFTGADANLIQAEKRHVEEIDFGFVGDVNRKSVNSKLLRKFLKLDLIPVFSAITHDHHGDLLNTNADSIASVLAQALSKKFDVELLFCFDKDGVLEDVNDNSTLIEALSEDDVLKLKEEKKIHKGILPKIENALLAKKHGVQKIFLINETKLQEHIIYDNQGTEIC